MVNMSFAVQDNSKWINGMDEQIMSWATSRPEVSKIGGFGVFWRGFYSFEMWQALESALVLKPPFILFPRIGTWEANVTCTCGEQGGTGSWQRLAEML